jgi:hypothetical protein
VGEVRAAVLDVQVDLAVVEQQMRARRQRCKDLRMRQRRARLAACRRIEIEAKRFAGHEIDEAVGKRAHAQLRPLQVEQDADRPPGIALDPADDLEALAMLLVRAVAEVQAEHVGAGVEQRAYGGGVRARGPERGDDLGVALTAHVCPSGRAQRRPLLLR